MSDLIIHEPLAAQIREAAAQNDQTPEEMLTDLLQQLKRERRAKQFETIMRPFGEEVERRGISEDELDARVEEIRQQLFETDYDDEPTT